MKRTDLEKLKATKIAGHMKQATVSARFGKDAQAPLDKREQRKRDQEQGLIAFAVKLPGPLVAELRATALEANTGLNEITAELLEAGLKARKK